MIEKLELLHVRKVGANNTVTLPDDLKNYPRIAFEKGIESGRIYARGIKKENSESE